MAIEKIEYQNKEAIDDVGVPEKNKVTAENMNEIKSVVNNNADEMEDADNALSSRIDEVSSAINNIVENTYTKTQTDTLLNGKQDTLESGTNIKTINNQSILGRGNINIQGGGTSNYNALTNKPKINNVELNGNKTSSDLGLQPAGNYALESDIPTKTSDLNNDSGFIDKNVNNLTNYYKTSETYNKTEIDNKISSVYKYKGTVATYADLPSTSLTIGDVYNVESTGDNYAWTGTVWDKLGGDIDLSGYQPKIDSTHKLSSDLVDDTGNTNKFVTTTEKQTWNNKLDESDLSDYVKNTDYATSATGGVIKLGSSYGTTITSSGNLRATAKTYEEYSSAGSYMFIGKGTLENVITGKGLIDTSKVKTTTNTTQGNVYDVTYINTMLGNIETLLAEV